MKSAPRRQARQPSKKPVSVFAAVAAFALAVSACGAVAEPTLRPTASPSPTATPTPSPTPTLASIVPVPIWQPGPPLAAAPTLDQATAAALQAAVDGARRRGAIPGVSVAVVFPDGTLWAGQAGMTAVSGGQQVTADTLFSVGSITKTFTAALALRLAQRGVIGLDDPVSTYLPSYPNGSKITIEMLLDHTSGIRDLFEAAAFASIDADHSARWTPEETLAIVGKPYFSPGRGYHYSSTNYVVLGQVLEAVTGQTMAQLVHTEFLEPLGLSHTFLQWQEDPAGPKAHGYWGPASAPNDLTGNSALLPYVSEATAVGAGGGIVSTASDIARWASALYGGGLLGPGWMTSMTDVSVTLPFKPKGLYGLGFEQLSIGGHAAWGHRGHLDGFQSAMAYFPDTGVTVVMLTNADWVNPTVSIAAIYKAIPGT